MSIIVKVFTNATTKLVPGSESSAKDKDSRSYRVNIKKATPLQTTCCLLSIRVSDRLNYSLSAIAALTHYTRFSVINLQNVSLMSDCQRWSFKSVLCMTTELLRY